MFQTNVNLIAMPTIFQIHTKLLMELPSTAISTPFQILATSQRASPKIATSTAFQILATSQRVSQKIATQMAFQILATSPLDYLTPMRTVVWIFVKQTLATLISTA